MRLKYPSGKKHTAVLLSLLIFLTGLVLAYWFALLHHRADVSHERSVVAARLDKARGEISRQVDSIVHLSQGLVSLVKIQQGITEAQFVAMAQATIASEPRIRNIALAPMNIIRFVYPMKGNERALNMDYLKNPDQRGMVLRAIREKKTVLAGPVNLVQGGIGIISRTPIFMNNSPSSPGEPLYWGIASTVIDFDTLIGSTGLANGTTRGIRFALRGKDGMGASGTTFWGDGRIFTRDPVLMDITLPSGSWQIAALPANGWPVFDPLKSLYFLFGCSLSLIFSILFFQLIRINSVLRQEIVERLDAEVAVRRSEEKYRSIFEDSTEGICQATPEGRFISVNPAMAHIYGYESPEEMIASVTDIGRQLYVDPEERARYKALLEAQGVTKGFETPSPRKDGTIIWVSLSSHIKKDANGNILYFDTMVEDITRRKEAEETLRTMSIVDDLTGLYNRRGFTTLAEQQLRVAERTGNGIVLLFADVDGLKKINDTLGHKSGDEAIVEAANVLQKVFREMDIIARMGGDEFAVFAPEASLDYTAIIRHRLQDQLAGHNSYAGRDYTLSLSVGMIYYDPSTPSSLDELISRADTLMYEQKRCKVPLHSQERRGT
jgi:diguanylate cyclase (GGDEF)-like protein/PAS domain S-box-containing protein